MSTKYEIAAAHVVVLSNAFWQALTTTTMTAIDDRSLAQLDSICPITDGKTFFYIQWTHGLSWWRSSPEADASSVDDPCAGLDWYILAYLTILVHILSWTSRWLLWEPLARYIAKRIQHPTFDRETCRKVSMNLTACLFFVASGVFAFVLFVREPWLYQPSQWLQGREIRPVAASVKLYYLLYSARFVSDSISLLFEVGRDATTIAVAFVHHFVTLGLIAVAVRGNYIRAAAVIMFFFDWVDPPLLIAKTCRNMSYRSDDFFQSAANVFFHLFAIIFILTRTIMYNFVAFTMVYYLDRHAIVERMFLLSLVALQTYWLTLLLAAVKRSLQNGGNIQQDSREKKTQ